MLWYIFKNLKHSSTRCEIAATFLATLPTWAVNMGVDNSATVGKWTKVIEHQRKRSSAKLRSSDGGLRLGGETTPLHRESPFKKRWFLMKDCDLWRKFAESVKAKKPWAVWLTKVKGHATDEQVAEGTVKEEDKQGNEKADEAADRGSKEEQENLAIVAGLYSRRNKKYQQCTGRVQNFLLQIR